MRVVYRAWILMAALMVLVLGGCGGFEKPEEGPTSATGQGKGVPAKKPERIYSMQIGHSQPVDNPRHQSFLLFKKLLEEKTDGGIQVDIYPAGQLGSEASMLEQVCDGTNNITSD